MSKKDHQKPADPEEYERFVKVAEEIQDENAENLFDNAIKKVLAKKKESEETAE